MAGTQEPGYFIVEDARGLDPPEPLVRALDCLDRLPPGERMLFLIHIEPRPLISILKRNGYSYRCDLAPEGFFRLSIWKDQAT